MEKHLLVPMATYVFYIWSLAVYNFRTRYQALKQGQVSHGYFKALQGTASDRVILVGRHYDNQFQLPVLFFITLVTHLVLAKANLFTLILAWTFLLSRFGHSYEHLGKNRITKRVRWFATGWLCIVALWIQILFLVYL